MRVAAVLLALLVAVCPLAAADRDLDRFIEARMREDRIPGLVVGFFRGDDTSVRAFGYADVENRLPMKPDASFRLASITKTLTAVAVLQLVEQGKIDLDADVRTYVPFFPRKPWPVTIRQLLGHLGGISHYRNRAVEQHLTTHHSIPETIAIFADFDLVAEPGTKYSYSTYGYVLLAAAIERASGQTYAAYMHDHVFAPLGMDSTREDDPIALIPNRVRGYQLAGGEVANSEFVDISTRVGGGATRSTVPDLLRFARGLMDGRLLSKVSMELMFTPMRTRDGGRSEYAMGCVPLPLPQLDTDGRFAVSNDGGQQETRTYLIFFPAQNAAIATAMNFELNTDDTLLQRLAQSVFGEPLDFAPVSADGRDDAVLRAMQRVFSLGVSDRDAHPSRQYTEGEVAKGLTAFTAAANGGVEDADALTILGRAMADALPSIPHDAPSFFDAYAKLRPGRFGSSLEARFPRWAADWRAVTPEAVRRVAVAADSDFPSLGRQLQSAFRGRSLRPDFANRFAAASEKLLLSGDRKRAEQAASVGAELYPHAGATRYALALTTLLAGRRADAERLLREGGADSGSMNRSAYALAGAKQLDAGIALLELATALHPRDPNLFDSLGELRLRAGDREGARAAYRKALEVDPTWRNAEEVLKTLQ
jgi:CubicO group peptidase (beta-lactamase class C family)